MSAFHGLPSLWISEEEILVLAVPFQFSLVGFFLSWRLSLDSILDNATSIGSRPSIACVLVKLDITKKYPDKVWIGPKKFSYIQLVEIEVFPPFCVHYKSIEHVRGECWSQSSVPFSYPLKSNVNKIGVLQNVFANGNVDVGVDGLGCGEVVVEPPLVVNGLSEPVALAPVGPVALDTGVNVLSLDLINIVSFVAKDLVLGLGATNALVGDVAASLADVYVGEDVAPLPIDCTNIDSVDGVDVSIDANNCCINLIASPTCADVVEVSGDNLVSLLFGRGEASTELSNAGVVVSLVNVPISVISNVDMLAHLARDNVVRQGHWLHDSFSSEGGEEIFENDVDARDNFNLSLLQIADGSFFKNSVKHRKRKSKKKCFFLFRSLVFVVIWLLLLLLAICCDRIGTGQ
ncbi:hypothetical protein IEQ34_008366 [Dendrobium chrysotoxum]|uniref:Uncharacterized protein n=1 Tax=Dendrobium chrysotoxum TaxID=161865 RepID=A0AAV7GXJ4_DENCH|nr:hypothetical protein IEQ34_008366 [Dendrobium chrysotoxum]